MLIKMKIQDIFGFIIIICFVLLVIYLGVNSLFNKCIKPYKNQLDSAKTMRQILGSIIFISVLIYFAYFYDGKDYFLKVISKNSLQQGTLYK